MKSKASARKKSAPKKSSSKKSVSRNRDTSRRNDRGGNSRRNDYDNELRGVLFPNKRKRKDSQPDYTGSAEIQGVEYWISGWANRSKQGQKFLSIAFTEIEEQEERNSRGRNNRDDDDDDDDELPF